MPWPDDGTDLEVTVRAAFGADVTAAPTSWSFTDLSSRLVTTNPITISRGLVVGQGSRRTASATVTLLNDDGALTPELVTSPFWPNVDLGTPMDLAVRTRTTPYIADTFTRTSASGWGTPETGPGGNWSGSTGLSVSGNAGKIAHSAVNTFRTTRLSMANRDIEVTFDTSIAAVVTGQAIYAGTLLRADNPLTNYIWPSLEYGLGGVVKWTLFTNLGGVFTTVGSWTQPGLTYGAGTMLRAHVRFVGDRLQARAWLAAGNEPTSWALDQTVTALPDGGPSLGFYALVTSGNTNVLPNVITVDNVTFAQPKYARIEGFIADVRPSFTPIGDGSFHSTVDIDIGGVQSRLERRTADDISPLRRSLEKAAVPPIAYWPLEDQAQATSAASAFPDQPAMVVTGPISFGVDLGDIDDPNVSKFGSAAVVSLATGAKLSAPVPVSASTSWTVGAEMFLFTALVGGGITEVRLFEWFTPSGTFQRWALVGTLTGHAVRAYDDVNGTTTDVITFANAFGGLISHAVTATQSGGNINLQLQFNYTNWASGSIAGTNAPVTKVTVNPDQKNTTLSTSAIGIRYLAGHVTVHDAVVQVLPVYFDSLVYAGPLRADRGWAYEAAHRRTQRLCDEEDVPFRVVGAPYDSGVTKLNAQSSGAFVQLVTDAIEAESGGLLWEGEFGLIHRPRTDRYNPPVQLSVDMSVYRRGSGTDPKEVLVPKLGNRGPNFWTVERRNGSSATAAAAKSLRDRRGTQADKATLDILYDSDCPPHAQWRTHLNVDGAGANYPNFVIDLAANPDLVDDWLICEIGSRVQRLNQPTIAGLGTIDQVIDGMSETISARQSGSGPGWTATLDTSPASVWETGVWDSPTSLWAPANTVLSSGVTTTATAWSMNSNGEPWVTGVVSLRAQLGAEEVLITNISGAGSAWTFTVTRSVNTVVASHTAGAEKLTLLDAGTWSL